MQAKSPEAIEILGNRGLEEFCERYKTELSQLHSFHEVLWNTADHLGHIAGSFHQPTPMFVTQHSNPLDDNSPIQQSWKVEGGVCGFAWVNIRPATSRFARWAKKRDIGHTDSYYGGLSIWISAHGQSMERKLAHAERTASILRMAGLNARAYSRMD